MANQIIQIKDSDGNIYSPRVNHLEAEGIYAVQHPNWDNSISVYNLAARFNGSIYKISGTAGTEGTNYPAGLPTVLQNRTMVCFRSQFAGRVTESGALHGVVVLYEVYPVTGRIWISTYNTSWGSWKVLRPHAIGDKWHYVGKLIQGTNTTTEGYGHADIILLQNELLQINFSARITAAGTESTGQSTYGIDSALLSSTIGATPVFVQGGNWIAVKSDGTLAYSDMGYGTIMNAANSGKYAQPARKYAVSGSDAGAWLSNHWAVGTIIQGTCFAKF